MHVVEGVSLRGPGLLSRRKLAVTGSPLEVQALFKEAVDFDGYLIYSNDCCIDDASVESMARVSLSFDRNAVVVPRVASSLGQRELTAESFVVLPRSAECMLVRSREIRLFGFDALEGDDLPESLLNHAFRLNSFGYSTLLDANAFVIRDKAERRFDGASSLSARYDYLNNSRILAESSQTLSLMEFRQTLESRKPRILFEFSDMRDLYCGTSELQVAVLKYFKQLYSDKYDYVVRCNKEAAEFHQLSRYGKVYSLEDDLPYCDLGFIASQPLQIDQQVVVSEKCVKSVCVMLDCILLRTGYLSENDPGRVDKVRSGLRYSDGIIAISDFCKHDYQRYYSTDKVINDKPAKTIYLSSDFEGSRYFAADREALPFSKYVLVVGNSFKHKALADFYWVAKETPLNYVIMGIDCPEERQANNIVCLKGSLLSDSFLDCLYDNCSCVVFPSQYEGFGLPITNAWRHGKKCIVCKNDLNEELQAYFSNMQANIALFQSFNEIEGLIDTLAKQPFEGSFSASWKDTVVDIEAFLDEVLSAPVDYAYVDERLWHFRFLEESIRDGKDHLRISDLFDERYATRSRGFALLAKGLRGMSAVLRRLKG